ncbi:ABC transporter permease subunit [Modicisalibacter radicis]|uniref:ABC transporter permease subunit n=1 Tax=Halomonas sp. EAR18 TaxID=2518972 RepID=UPI00109CEF7D|nr:ABC transporter permease subunit [Halomonas sp. EAR18]
MLDIAPSASRRRRRQLRDRLASLVIRAAGTGVIAAVLAIGVFLVVEVLPLFAPARIDSPGPAAGPAMAASETIVGGVTLDADTLLTLTPDGRYRTRSLDGAPPGDWDRLPSALLAGQRVTGVVANDAALVLALAGGDVIRIPRGTDGGPEGARARRYALFAETRPAELALAGDSRRWWLAGRSEEGRVAVLRGGGQDDASREAAVRRFTVPQEAEHLALDGDGRLVLASGPRLAVWTLDGDRAQALGDIRALDGPDRRITALSYLAGGETLLVGDNRGQLRRWLDRHDGRAPLIAAPSDPAPLGEAISRLLPLPGKHAALALDAHGGLGLYQALSGRRWQGRAPSGEPLAWGVAGEERLWWLDEKGLQVRTVRAEHAAVTWRTLWQAQLYEGHTQPVQRWQAEVGGAGGESRFNLTPLAWGTLKAAGWALLFAVPLALAAAVHTAVYMPARLRNRVRPALELMEALPGVVIGFVAGLVIAPYVDRHLAGTLALALVVPLGLLLVGALWARLPARLQHRLPLGWAGLWLVPWLALLCAASLTLSPWLEATLFGGDLQGWLASELGLTYVTRNAMIVGVAMGFAVIPTIYALAEDALSGVPRALDEGARALGATRWQALWRVWLPAASPGLLSAVMIGAGRAVGETMIVLMATGNTALMSVSPFEGLRSIAANIAIELPEAAFGGTHYRVLLLSALVLFAFTFAVNTLAEVVRQRLQRRYRRLGGSR